MKMKGFILTSQIESQMKKVEMVEKICAELETFHKYVCGVDRNLSDLLTYSLSRKRILTTRVERSTVRSILSEEQAVSERIRELLHQIVNSEEEGVNRYGKEIPDRDYDFTCGVCGQQYIASIYVEKVGQPD